jgi:hypothetical protein
MLVIVAIYLVTASLLSINRLVDSTKSSNYLPSDVTGSDILALSMVATRETTIETNRHRLYVVIVDGQASVSTGLVGARTPTNETIERQETRNW